MLTNKMLQKVSRNGQINRVNLKEFLSNICKMYHKFKKLSRQYALRLITILTK